VTPIRLGVNLDHVATIRQVRRGDRPDPVDAAREAEAAGADSIVCHLREDRRHIQDRDVRELRRKVRTALNLEMGLAPEIVEIALRVRPDQVTLVPERRRELTTEGGLDVRDQIGKVRRAAARFEGRGIEVSLFIDPDLRQVEAAAKTGARIVEFHTGEYAGATGPAARRRELDRLAAAARAARGAGLVVAAGHGLDYGNVRAAAAIPEIEELNIGYSIVSRALFEGLGRAVRGMKRLMNAARRGE
jgi:pyridoxine 5-phosphate synthase